VAAAVAGVETSGTSWIIDGPGAVGSIM